MRYIKRNKFGLAENPIGLIVTMSWKGRDLLGTVRDTYRREVTDSIHLKITHFNGEWWPIEPIATVVHVVD